MTYSPLQSARYAYQPKLPALLQTPVSNLVATIGTATAPNQDQDALKAMFPNTYGLPMVQFIQGDREKKKTPISVGFILSGGPAAGGHNVISGLFDALKQDHPGSRLIGFKGGPSGILENKFIEITEEYLKPFRNTGGFDIVGSGRTKLETEEQFAICAKVCQQHGISALVIIGGDDSNTNAAILAEYFLHTKSGIQVIGCPKTIDGDLKNESIEVSFGFDTATKTYSELIGNIQRDAVSSRKYWHFIKLMGRSASHIALECALQCRPNICLISEEVEQKKLSLEMVVQQICDAIAKRAELNLNFGVVLIPEGLIEFIPEVKQLIQELNTYLNLHAQAYACCTNFEAQQQFISSYLSASSLSVFLSLPAEIRQQLLFDRDPHGNVQVSRIDTEKLLIIMVGERLKQMKKDGTYTGIYSAYNHFFGYEGRCAFPSNFDADYCYSIGFNAYLLIASGLSGYLSSITHLSKPAEQWKAGGVPITMMMNLEERHGSKKPVIKKALVELEGKPFSYFASKRNTWAVETAYTFPGPIQYFGPTEVCDATPRTLLLEQS